MPLRAFLLLAGYDDVISGQMCNNWEYLAGYRVISSSLFFR